MKIHPRSAFRLPISALVLLLLSLPAFAARKKHAPAKPAGPQLPGQKVTFPTKDGWTLTGNFQPPANGHLTLLMLHGVGSNRGEWTALATRLMADGYGFLAYDGRGHAESTVHASTATPTGTEKLVWRKFASRGADNEWNQMQNDVDAAMLFLSSAGVSGSSVAFCGASIGANVLLNAAVARPEVRFAVLLSPGINYRDVMTVNPIRKYGKRPLLLAVATSDNYAFQSAQLLYNLAVPLSGKEHVLILQTDMGHGAPMLDNPAMMDAVLGWIQSEELGHAFVPVTPSTATVAPSTPTPTIPH